MLRCSGGSVRVFDDTRRSPTLISPSDGSRKPAISRSVVVLPQPDGPSRQTSCPWSIVSETLSTTASDEKRLVSPRKSTDANASSQQALRISVRSCQPIGVFARTEDRFACRNASGRGGSKPENGGAGKGLRRGHFHQAIRSRP